jgi:hypothetical protein
MVRSPRAHQPATPLYYGPCIKTSAAWQDEEVLRYLLDRHHLTNHQEKEASLALPLPLRLAMKSTKMPGGGLIMKPLLVAICLALGGCGVVAKIDARTEYQKSVADYRACLDANPNDIHACDAKRLAMEVARRTCRQQSDCWTTANINVQSR